MKDVIKLFSRLIFLGVVAYGWVMNIVHLVQNDFIWTSGLSIGRLVGIFVLPIGIVLGYL